MSDRLLPGWETIHKALFHDENGDPVISLSTLMQKYGPEMKELGVLFEWTLGRGKRRILVGWESKIKQYFILKQRKKDEKKEGQKAIRAPG